jgi:nucleotide-binding universal stress UspA family protein
VTVGPSHRGPVGRVLAGTTADRLLSGAPCPVALAPRGYAEAVDAFKRVVAGYDGSEESGLALQVAVELASLAGVRLRIVAVAEPPTAVRTEAEIDLAEVVERSVRRQADRLAADGAGSVAVDVTVERDAAWGETGTALASAARAARGRRVPAGPDRRASLLSGPGEDHRPSRNGGYSSRMSATYAATRSDHRAMPTRRSNTSRG